jgi:Domain of unknown function DUF11
MKKTLVRFFGGAVMVCGTLLGLPTSAHAQISIDANMQSGAARQSLLQVIHVTNGGSAEATGVTVTFTAPKGTKVDSTCPSDRFHGVLSYTCFVGTIPGGQTADVTFSISMNKSGDVDVEVTCDLGTFVDSLQITIF